MSPFLDFLFWDNTKLILPYFLKQNRNQETELVWKADWHLSQGSLTAGQSTAWMGTMEITEPREVRLEDQVRRREL